MSILIPIITTLLGGAVGSRAGQIAERRLDDLDIHDILEQILEIIRDDPGLTVEERVLAVQNFIDWVTTTGVIVGENGLYEIPWSIPLPFIIPLPTPITSIDLSFRVPVRLIERLQAFVANPTEFPPIGHEEEELPNPPLPPIFGEVSIENLDVKTVGDMIEFEADYTNLRGDIDIPLEARVSLVDDATGTAIDTWTAPRTAEHGSDTEVEGSFLVPTVPGTYTLVFEVLSPLTGEVMGTQKTISITVI